MNIRVPGKLRLTTRRDAEASKLSGERKSRCNGVDWGGRQIRLLIAETGCREQALSLPRAWELAAKKSFVWK